MNSFVIQEYSSQVSPRSSSTRNKSTTKRHRTAAVIYKMTWPTTGKISYICPRIGERIARQGVKNMFKNRYPGHQDYLDHATASISDWALRYSSSLFARLVLRSMTAGSSSRSLESCFICIPNGRIIRYDSCIIPHKAFLQQGIDGFQCLQHWNIY